MNVTTEHLQSKLDTSDVKVVVPESLTYGGVVFSSAASLLDGLGRSFDGVKYRLLSADHVKNEGSVRY